MAIIGKVKIGQGHLKSINIRFFIAKITVPVHVNVIFYGSVLCCHTLLNLKRKIHTNKR